MKKLLFILLLLPFMAPKATAQYEFGDIQVDTFPEIFNPDNNQLWKGRKGVFNSSRKFNEENSDVWVDNNLSGLVQRDKPIKLNSATFTADNKFDQDAIHGKLLKQMKEQFGDPKKGKATHPRTGAEIHFLIWKQKEGSNIYQIQLVKFGTITQLVIKKSEALPDF